MTDPSHERVTLAILATKLDYLIRTVDQVVVSQAQSRERLTDVEETVRILKWVSAFVGTVAVALLIAWVKTILSI